MSNKTKKPIKVSKNRKKSWRKHCPVEDIEEYLENDRFNERIGGSIADKSDDSLFVIEKTVTNNVNKKDTKEVKAKPTKITKRPSKLKEIQSNLKLFKLLESQSKVKPIPSRIGSKNVKKNFLNDDKKFAKLWPQKKLQFLRLDQKREKQKLIKKDPKLRFEVYDMWDNCQQRTDLIDEDMKELIDYQEVLKGSKPPKVPKHHNQKLTLLPSIEVPESGQSYNPDHESHQKLLKKAFDVEVNKVNEEKRLKRLVENYYVSKAEAPNDRSYVNEMSHGLGLSDNEDKEDEEDDNELNESIQLIGRSDRKKTKAQRNKELLQKQLKLKKQLDKEEKFKANDIFRLKTFIKQLKRKEKESQEKQKRRTDREKSKLLGPKRLSRHKYEKPDIELNLTNELTGSLRTIKTEGNILEDRFKSFQRRNIIETRVRQAFKRRYKMKKYTKKSSQDPIV